MNINDSNEILEPSALTDVQQVQAEIDTPSPLLQKEERSGGFVHDDDGQVAINGI